MKEKGKRLAGSPPEGSLVRKKRKDIDDWQVGEILWAFPVDTEATPQYENLDWALEKNGEEAKKDSKETGETSST